jgi:hypothetical protein
MGDDPGRHITVRIQVLALCTNLFFSGVRNTRDRPIDDGKPEDPLTKMRRSEEL